MTTTDPDPVEPGSAAAFAAIDLYELTMAASYLRRNLTAEATFSLFVRRLPADRSFLVAAGLDDALGHLEHFGFGDRDLVWLAENGFDEEAVGHLADLRFAGDVWAVPEGRLVFPNEPLIEVTAPLPQAQLVETIVLNQITYQTALATKAARCRLGAAGRAELIDFSARRTHGVEAGMRAARAAVMAGFAGTSNVGAARQLGVPAVGTMAHSYVQIFDEEEQAFSAFATDFGERTTFLVDTYDTLAGVERAISAAERTGLRGRFGIRLDSGDLLDLSIRSRRLLDDVGLGDVRIVASGGLDEFEIERLLDAGAPIDVFGVGTRIGVSRDAPSLDSAYKVVEYDGRPVMKLSEGKRTLPGRKQIYRTHLGRPDLLTTRDDVAPNGAEPLLRPVMASGARIEAPEPISTIRDRLVADLDQLPTELRELRGRTERPVVIAPALAEVAEATARRAATPA